MFFLTLDTAPSLIPRIASCVNVAWMFWQCAQPPLQINADYMRALCCASSHVVNRNYIPNKKCDGIHYVNECPHKYRKTHISVCVCVSEWPSYLQLGEDFLDVAVAALCYVHVFFITLSLEHRLGSIWEVLVEGKVCSYSLHPHILALFRPDLAHVLLPSRYHL